MSFTYKMAPKTSCHIYVMKLRHCHPVYLKLARMSNEISCCVYVLCIAYSFLRRLPYAVAALE